MSKKNELTIENKCALVRKFAGKLITKFDQYELSEEEVLFSMARWAKENGFQNYWFAIDTELQKQYECASWFWIVRRLRNYRDYWNVVN